MSESTKTITAWLVVDWRTGKHRTRKSKPGRSDLGTNELLCRLNLDVTVPDVDVPTLSAAMEVPEPRIHAATMEALDEDDLPDWTSTATDVLADDEDAIRQEDAADVERIVDSLVGRTLMDAPGRPDPALVREYVDDMVADLRDGGETA